MKTQIIQLHHNDDVVSVRDKMSWCQTGRILLVWPTHGRVLTRQLDLILAKRYASTLGSDLALATYDPDVRYNAKQLGIPVFADARQAQEQEWVIRHPKLINHLPRAHLVGLDNLRKLIRSKKPRWTDTPFAKIICLGVSLLTLVILAIFILPGAKVTYSPKEAMQSVKLDLTADPSATTINLSAGSLPTYIQEVTVEGTDSITTTGIMTVPEKTASGVLNFTNRSKTDITLPAGTIVATLGTEHVRFELVSADDIIIKPKKSVLVEAQALKPGTSGNLPADSLVALEGALGNQLVVTNPDATSGGEDIAVPTGTAQDLQAIRARLTSRLIQEALTGLHTNLPSDDTLLPQSATISKILEETYYPTAGVPADQVEVTLQLIIKVQVVPGDLLRQMASTIFDSDIPPGYSPVINTLAITPLTMPTLEAGSKVSWTVSASRKLLADIPKDIAVASITGASIEQAAERLSASMPLAAHAQIELIPNWWPRLPLLAMRIKLVEADNQ
jgi:hypothetical protein